MRKHLFFFFFLIALNLYADTEEEPSLRRVDAYFLLGDFSSAFHEAKASVRAFPTSKKSAAVYVEALTRFGRLPQALNFWEEKKELLENSNDLCERVCWAVLEDGLKSGQYSIKLASLIGSSLTRDAKAIPFLLAMMKDNNAVLRSVAIELAIKYRDTVLQKEILRLLKEDPSWFSRVEAIRACGQLQNKEAVPYLKKIAASEHVTFEEKALAIEALVNIYEKADIEEISYFAQSSRAGLRCFSCELATYFQVSEAKKQILSLVGDSRADVRIAAWNAIGLYYRSEIEKETILPLLQKGVKDPDSTVAITAAWVALFLAPTLGEEYLTSWLEDVNPENRRLAAAAIAAAGNWGEKIALTEIEKNADPYVQMNLALGLIGQRSHIQLCSDILFTAFTKKKQMWMWESQKNRLFQILGPSQVRHLPQIPNYPEAVDTMTTLQMLSLLAVLEDSRAPDAIKHFLQKKGWGVTGVAAATLLQEGDAEALELIRSLLNDQEMNVRIQAALVMAFLGKDHSVHNVLKEAYSKADYDMKLHILEALGQLQNKENINFFLETLKEPFAILRMVDASSLLQTIYY